MRSNFLFILSLIFALSISTLLFSGALTQDVDGNSERIFENETSLFDFDNSTDHSEGKIEEMSDPTESDKRSKGNLDTKNDSIKGSTSTQTSFSEIEDSLTTLFDFVDSSSTIQLPASKSFDASSNSSITTSTLDTFGEEKISLTSDKENKNSDALKQQATTLNMMHSTEKTVANETTSHPITTDSEINDHQTINLATKVGEESSTTNRMDDKNSSSPETTKTNEEATEDNNQSIKITGRTTISMVHHNEKDDVNGESQTTILPSFPNESPKITSTIGPVLSGKETPMHQRNLTDGATSKPDATVGTGFTTEATKQLSEMIQSSGNFSKLTTESKKDGMAAEKENRSLFDMTANSSTTLDKEEEDETNVEDATSTTTSKISMPFTIVPSTKMLSESTDRIENSSTGQNSLSANSDSSSSIEPFPIRSTSFADESLIAGDKSIFDNSTGGNSTQFEMENNANSTATPKPMDSSAATTTQVSEESSTTKKEEQHSGFGQDDALDHSSTFLRSLSTSTDSMVSDDEKQTIELTTTATTSSEIRNDSHKDEHPSEDTTTIGLEEGSKHKQPPETAETTSTELFPIQRNTTDELHGDGAGVKNETGGEPPQINNGSDRFEVLTKENDDHVNPKNENSNSEINKMTLMKPSLTEQDGTSTSVDNNTETSLMPHEHSDETTLIPITNESSEGEPKNRGLEEDTTTIESKSKTEIETATTNQQQQQSDLATTTTSNLSSTVTENGEGSSLENHLITPIKPADEENTDENGEKPTTTRIVSAADEGTTLMENASSEPSSTTISNNGEETAPERSSTFGAEEVPPAQIGLENESAIKTPFSLRFPTIEFRTEFEDKSSGQFNKFKEQISDDLRSLFKEVFGDNFIDFVIVKLRQGSVILDGLILSRSELMDLKGDTERIEDSLRTNFTGRLGGNSVDKNSITIAGISSNTSQNENALSLLNSQNPYIVLGAIALGVLIIVFATFALIVFGINSRRTNRRMKLKSDDIAMTENGHGRTVNSAAAMVSSGNGVNLTSYGRSNGSNGYPSHRNGTNTNGPGKHTQMVFNGSQFTPPNAFRS